MLTLTQTEFKNFLLYRQGIIGDYQFIGKEGVMACINRIHSIQYDPVNVCGKNAEIVLNARVKNFDKKMLYELLYVDRKLIEGYDKKLCLFNREDWKFLLPVRYSKLRRRKDPLEALQIRDQIIDLLHCQEYVSVKNFETKNRYNWYWGHSASIYQIALERLFIEGRICIAYREGNIKYYTLNKLYDREQREILDDDYYKWHIQRRIESIGALWCSASPAWDYIPGCTQKIRKKIIRELLEQNKIMELKVQAIEGEFYCSTKDLQYLEVKDDSCPKRVEFIAPLDNIIWDRDIVSRVFGFNYKWEVYIPEKKRKFCSYCLPVLWGNEFVGRIDIKVEDSQLRVRNIWIEKQIDWEFLWQLKNKIKEFAKFNHCKGIDAECLQNIEVASSWGTFKKITGTK